MTETIKLNLIPDTTELPVLHCSQFDDGRIMYVDLFEGEQPFILAEGSVVKVNIRKLDNNVISNVCTYETIEESFSRVTVTATEQMTACFGRSYGELQITVNDTVIGTLNFYLDVERDPMQGGIDSVSEIDNLTGQIEDIVEEVIGDDYYNKSQVDDLLSGKADASALNNYYTKTQADNLLSGKADASALNNYYTKTQADNLLSGKANASDLDNYYTKTEVDQKFLDIMPVKSVAKSPIASFYTSIGNYPIVDMKCYINPMQSGSGDPAPDNIRPITGVSSVNVTRIGKNIADAKNFLNVSGWAYDSDENCYYGSTVNLWDYYRDNLSHRFIPKQEYGRCTISFKYKNQTSDNHNNRLSVGFHYTDNTWGWNSCGYYDEYVDKVFTSNASKTVDAIAFGFNAGGTIYLKDFMMEIGNTATEYEPFVGNTYTIALGDTYYGATLDVVRGKLTIAYGFVDLGDLSWLKDTTVVSGKIIFRSSLSAKTTFNAICSNYKFVGAYTNLTDKTCCYIYNTWIGIEDSTYNESTAEQFKTAMSGAQLVYELATPIEIDLTPTQINSLLGSNNIWHDGNGDIELKFKETIQDWLDQM